MIEHKMAIRKRINITLHPIEIDRLDKIAKENKETRSGMIRRLIDLYHKK